MVPRNGAAGINIVSDPGSGIYDVTENIGASASMSVYACTIVILPMD